MATSTIFNFNFNNSEIVDSTGQWYDATTGTVTTEFINHDGNTALLQRAYTYIAGTSYLRDINPVFFQSRDPTFTAHTYTIELQIYPLRDSGGYGPWDGDVLDFNPDADDEEGWVKLKTLQRASESNTFYWREYGLGPDGAGIPFLTVTAADGTYNRWYSIRIERVDDGTNTGATIKIYVDGTLVANETLTYPQDARKGRIGSSIRYTYRRNSTSPEGAGVAIDNFKLTAGIAPSSVVDVSLANLQRNNANLLSFIKGKVPTVNNATLTIQRNGTTLDTFTANASTDKTVNIQCVDLTNNQTIGGQKIFSHIQIGVGRDLYHFALNPYAKNTPPANTSYQYINFSGNTASQGFANNWYSGYLEQVVYTNGSARGRWLIRDTSESSLGIELFVNGSDKQFRPQGNNITDLGTSTNKWKSFNGINPGALSLPIVDSGIIAVDTTTFQWGTNWIYTPVFDGWIVVEIPASSATERRYAVSQGSLRYWYPNQNGEIFRFAFPARKDVPIYFAFTSDIEESAAPAINLLKAQGNV